MMQAKELMLDDSEFELQPDNSAAQIELDMAAIGYEAANVEVLDTGDKLPF
jgi:hypothetical protein